MNQRGDTLIEVVVSAAVLALLIVLSIGIMNGGTARAERAVEGTFVRQGIDSQTELLRYARDGYVNKDAGGDALWNAIRTQRIATPMKFDQIAGLDGCTPMAGHRAFWLATEGGQVRLKTEPFESPATYAVAGKGLWVEATPQTNTNYIDFYIFACWDAPGSGPKATAGTIVRLYAPAP